MSVLVWSQSRITKLTDLVNSNLDFLWIVPSPHAFKDIADYSSNISMNFTVAWFLGNLLAYITWCPFQVLAAELATRTGICHGVSQFCTADVEI